MSVEEIRWWLTELRRRGWGTRVLGRTMGLRNPQCVMAKADGRQWIYPREQIRMSYVLRRIISGELVCINGKPGRGNAGKAVLADNPVPLKMPLRMNFDIRTGRVGFVPLELPAPMLPSFKTLLENPREWRNHRKASSGPAS
jgi:hypothetical protein